jgi:hypothetical protein
LAGAGNLPAREAIVTPAPKLFWLGLALKGGVAITDGTRDGAQYHTRQARHAHANAAETAAA